MSFNQYFGAGTIYVPDLSDENRIFDSNLSYNKGSWVLHMLRRVLGDADLLRRAAPVLRPVRATRPPPPRTSATSARRSRGGTSTPSSSSGSTASTTRTTAPTGRPRPAAGGYDVTLTLDQVQSWQLFNMPLDVTITHGGGRAGLRGPGLAGLADLHPARGRRADRRGRGPGRLDPQGPRAPVVDPPLDRHVLLVNGVDWASYGTEITSAYTDRAFWGDYTIDFWDNFATPGGRLPGDAAGAARARRGAPRGDGALPGRDLGRQQLQRRPGVVDEQPGPLVPARGRERAAHVAVRATSSSATRCATTSASTSRPARRSTTASPRARAWARSRGSAPRTRASSSTPSARARTPSCSTRWSRTTRPTAGSAFIRQPAEGGTHRAGRRALHLPLRPALSLEPRGSRDERRCTCSCTTSASTRRRWPWRARPRRPRAWRWARPGRTRSAPPRCSASRSRVRAPVRLEVLDPQGRRVRRLFAGPLGAGPHELTWDGRDEQGNGVATGIYWVRIEAGTEAATQKVVRMR